MEESYAFAFNVNSLLVYHSVQATTGAMLLFILLLILLFLHTEMALYAERLLNTNTPRSQFYDLQIVKSHHGQEKIRHRIEPFPFIILHLNVTSVNLHLNLCVSSKPK